MLGLSWLGLFGLSDRARLPPPAIRVIGWDLLVGRYSSRQRATANTKTRGPASALNPAGGPQCLCVSEYAVVYRCGFRIGERVSFSISVPFRFPCTRRGRASGCDDFKGQIGDRPFDEDKSVVCGGGDYMVGMFSFRAWPADFRSAC